MQPAIEALAHALHVMLGHLFQSEYIAIGRFGRDLEFVSNADAFPRRALDFAGSLPPTSLVNAVLPTPDREAIRQDPAADRKARRALAVGLGWLGDGETLLISAMSRGFDVELIHVDGRERAARVNVDMPVEQIAEALRSFRPE